MSLFCCGECSALAAIGPVLIAAWPRRAAASSRLRLSVEFDVVAVHAPPDHALRPVRPPVAPLTPRGTRLPRWSAQTVFALAPVRPAAFRWREMSCVASSGSHPWSPSVLAQGRRTGGHVGGLPALCRSMASMLPLTRPLARCDVSPWCRALAARGLPPSQVGRPDTCPAVRGAASPAQPLLEWSPRVRVTANAAAGCPSINHAAGVDSPAPVHVFCASPAAPARRPRLGLLAASCSGFRSLVLPATQSDRIRAPAGMVNAVGVRRPPSVLALEGRLPRLRRLLLDRPCRVCGCRPTRAAGVVFPCLAWVVRGGLGARSQLPFEALRSLVQASEPWSASCPARGSGPMRAAFRSASGPLARLEFAARRPLRSGGSGEGGLCCRARRCFVPSADTAGGATQSCTRLLHRAAPPVPVSVTSCQRP